jgi:ribosome-associated heat shock protein Hsp15
LAELARQRLDKWLWCARLVRQRETAAELVVSGHVRLNRQKVVKPGHAVGPGDVLTIAVHGGIRVLEVVAVAERRGKAAGARSLYRDLTMPDSGDGAAQKEDAS